VTAKRPPEPERLSELPPLARIAFVIWLVVQNALPFLYFASFVSVVLGWKAGGYVTLIGFATHFVVYYVMRGAMIQAAGELDDLTERVRIFLYTGVGCLSLAFLGVCLTPTGSHAAAVIIVVGLLGHLACHVGAALVNYRRVMARPWPAVAAVIDEDDW
jgi:hypothetical protein